jgi:hypothetical protein
MKNKIQPEIKELSFELETHRFDLLGVEKKYLFIKIEGIDELDDSKCIIVLKILEKDFNRLSKEYIDTKRSFCERYASFCGVFGCHYPDNFSVIGNISILVDDEDSEDGCSYLEVPLIEVSTWSKPDMEHG